MILTYKNSWLAFNIKRNNTDNIRQSFPQHKLSIVVIIIPRCRFAYRWAMDDLHLPFDILSTSSLHGITKTSLVLLLLRSSVQGVYY